MVLSTTGVALDRISNQNQSVSYCVAICVCVCVAQAHATTHKSKQTMSSRRCSGIRTRQDRQQTAGVGIILRTTAAALDRNNAKHKSNYDRLRSGCACHMSKIASQGMKQM